MIITELDRTRNVQVNNAILSFRGGSFGYMPTFLGGQPRSIPRVELGGGARRGYGLLLLFF